MSDCNLDGINMCCWTHGVDIDSADYAEGYCSQGWWEHENQNLDEDELEDGPRWDDESTRDSAELLKSARGTKT